MFVPEEKTVEINGTKYLIKALPADYGFSVLNKLQTMMDSPSPEFIKELVMKSVTANNVQPTNEWYNRHFARNYKELMDLFREIVEFNFEDLKEDPNEVGGEDTTE